GRCRGEPPRSAEAPWVPAAVGEQAAILVTAAPERERVDESVDASLSETGHRQANVLPGVAIRSERAVREDGDPLVGIGPAIARSTQPHAVGRACQQRRKPGVPHLSRGGQKLLSPADGLVVKAPVADKAGVSGDAAAVSRSPRSTLHLKAARRFGSSVTNHSNDWSC